MARPDGGSVRQAEAEATAAPDAERRNLVLLVAAQALLFTHNVILITVNGLAGLALAQERGLATLPVTAYVVGAACATYPASLWMRRVGRRAGFLCGAAFGMLGAGLCTLAMQERSFWLLCLATLVAGVYNAFGGYYRFAAGEIVGVERRSRAISWVVFGGIVGGVVGPETTKITRDLLVVPFAGAYASLIVLAALAMLVTSRMQLPAPSAFESHEPGRPVSAIVTQPSFVVASMSAMVGYGVMNLLMTATPIAMAAHRHAYDSAAFVIEWHVIGMFAPSFVTGTLVQRFGVLRVIGAGIGLMLACAAVALAGTTMPHFWVSLVLLGVGWNFMFIGGTTLLAESHSAGERAKAQGTNDALVFATMAASSLTSGVVVTHDGWHVLCLWSLPFLALAAGLVRWLGWLRGRAPVAA